MRHYIILIGLMLIFGCSDDDSLFSGEGRISGLVQFMNPKSNVEADTAKGVEITIVQFNEAQDTLAWWTFVSNNGTYDLPFLNPGMYSLIFNFEQGGVIYNETMDDIKIRNDFDIDISPTLIPSNGNYVFQGVVTVDDDLLTRSESSPPAAFAVVNLLNPDTEEVAYSTITNDAGEYAIDSLGFGDYTL